MHFIFLKAGSTEEGMILYSKNSKRLDESNVHISFIGKLLEFEGFQKTIGD